MAKKNNRSKVTQQKIEGSPPVATQSLTWHQSGIAWLIVAIAAFILGIGFGALMLFDLPAVTATFGAMGALLVVILSIADLRQWAMRMSHLLATHPWLQRTCLGLLALVLLLWIFPGRAKLLSLNCGDLGCKEEGIAFRFAFEPWSGHGQAPGLDAEVAVNTVQDVLFQKLSCLNGFRGVEPLTENIRDEIDFSLKGDLNIQNKINLSIEFIDAKKRQPAQTISEFESLPKSQVETDLMLLSLSNKAFEGVIGALQIQLQPEDTELVNRIPTDNAEALRLNNEAVQLILQRQTAQAQAQLEQAIKLDKRYADAYNNLGRLNREKGDLIQAIENYKLAAELLPCIATYHYNLAFAYEEDSEYDRAIDSYKAALARNPAHVQALNNLGFVYLQTHQFAEAEQYLQLGLRIVPNAPYLHKNLGRVYLEQGRIDDAIKALQQAVTLFSNYAEAHYFLAEAYRQANQQQNACVQLTAYAPLAETDKLDAPARVQAATTLSMTLNCSGGSTTP